MDRKKQEISRKAINQRVNILKRSEVFLGLSDEILEKMVTSIVCTRKIFDTNEIIFGFGDIAKELFIVEDGKVNLILIETLPHLEARVEAVVDTVCTGGTIGWSSLMGSYTYSTNAVCVEPAKILAINGPQLLHFLDSDRDIGYEVFKSLFNIINLRLRDSTKALIKIIAQKKESGLTR